MGKRVLLLLLCTLLLAVPAWAQDATEEAMPSVEPWVCPEGFAGQQLNVFNWSLYIGENTVADFEAACDVTVIYDTYVSNEDLLSRLREGNPGYDIIVPTGYMIEIMIAEGLLEPINLDNIPNIANVSPDLLDPPYDPGNVHTVPYMWGVVGIAYNTTMVAEPPTSWQAMFDYEGNVAWLEDMRAMLGVGLIMLGYDANSEDPAQIAEARDFLVENGANVSNIVAGNSQELLSNGSVAMAVDYAGNTFQLQMQCECDDYAYAVPVEGANIWVDNMAIPVGAPNPELAMVFMDYILHPQVSADITNFVVYATPNQMSIEAGLVNEEILNNPAIYPPAEARANLFYVDGIITPEAEQAYLDAWDEIKVLLGQ
jgi:spermidine/putrescine transport system substrate-binding protein